MARSPGNLLGRFANISGTSSLHVSMVGLRVKFKTLPDHGESMKTGSRETVLRQSFQKVRYFRT